ncbi:MAG: SDR family oxidoreductase [Cyclobacteriaceae bacterium]
MKNYLIIGASSGIGLQLASYLSAEGHQVDGTYNTNEGSSSRDNLTYHKLNVLDKDLDLSFIPEELHGLIYCPGTINLKPFARIKPEDFTADFNLQVVGAIKILQQVLPNLKRSGNASILFFSTIAVKLGFNFHSQVATSKGAIEGLAKSLAAELAPHIRVNCIAPSLTDTPLASRLLSTVDKKEANAKTHPLQKIGEPAYIADTASFLLSDKAQWTTGQILHVDGGLSSVKM